MQYALVEWQLLSPRARAGVAAGLLISAATIGFYSLSGNEAIAGPPPLPNVTISQPLSRNITEWDDYTGRFEASQSVEIRPRVAGQLVGVHFQDGDIVRKGQLLFSIDRRPFQASLSEALARAVAAQTQLALSRSEYARAARLIDAEAVSQEEVDSLRAAMRAGEAGVAAAQAMVRQRQLDMEFTQIRSPVTGRISDRKIDVGNLVGPADSVLTTVFALDPITGQTPRFSVFDTNRQDGINAADGRNNVMSVSVGILSLPSFLVGRTSGGVVSEKPGSRGQTGAREGGVEFRDGSGSMACSSASNGRMIAGVSDTSAVNETVKLSECKGRVSWRQIQ